VLLTEARNRAIAFAPDGFTGTEIDKVFFAVTFQALFGFFL
jgi:hypothetical protein